MTEPDDVSLVDDTIDAPDKRKSRIYFSLLLLILIAILLVCLVIGIQAFGIFYSIMFPPVPPSPPNLIEIRHTSSAHGIDEWLYRTDQDACDIVQFYEAQDGECHVFGDACSSNAPESTSVSRYGRHVATCTGAVKFNIFAYRWNADISDRYQFEDGATQFELTREVFWTGAVPPRIDTRRGFDFGN